MATHYGKGAEFRSQLILFDARQAATSPPTRNDECAQVPIILSAVAVEAFFHELCWLLDGNVLRARGDATLETLKDTLQELESSRSPIRTKYLLTHFLLSGKSVSKGTPPYQDFDLLLRLRDALVHPKVATFDMASPEKSEGFKLVRALASRSLIPTNSEQSGLVWTRTALVPSVARWLSIPAVPSGTDSHH